MKVLFRLRNFFLHSLIFLRTEVIATRIKDSRCLLYLPFLTYLTAKPNELNTELQGEKRKTILFIFLTFIGPCIANIFAEYNQQDEMFLNLFISVRSSTCFRRFFRPSSGAQNCTYSVRYLSDQYCYQLLDWP